jgi:hypothetical protein
MSKRKNTVIENYKVFLGSCSGRNYEESLIHCQEKANTLKPRDRYHYEITDELKILSTGVGDVFYCMYNIGNAHEAQASIDLLLKADIKAFKQNAYVGAKLKILGQDGAHWGYYSYSTKYFTSLLSDNQELKEFLILNQDMISGSLNQKHYKGNEIYPYFNRSALLALSGDWELLKERSLRFLKDETRAKSTKQLEPDFEFFMALANQDADVMKQVLENMLAKRLARKVGHDLNLWFDFYLCMPVLMYAKIAAIHGFDLGIDSPIAPKELIEVKPLESYEDPYDFMKEFDFHQPQQVWIDRWKAKMEAGLAWREREYKKLKNRILRFFGRGGRLIDLQPSSPIDKK